MKTGKLTKCEAEIAELFAWGAGKKDIANRLFISERTVENHARKIYEKTGCSKVNELSAWWFCTKFHISFDLSPLKRKVIATTLVVLMCRNYSISTIWLLGYAQEALAGRSGCQGQEEDLKMTLQRSNFNN